MREYVDVSLWDEQAGDVIEFYAAWTPLTEYKASRHNLMRLLAGRKACRNFRAVRGRPGLPKSSLDGARESVWLRGKVDQLSSELKIALRLSRGEQLDCVGLTKRLGAKHNFPSVTRIAAEPWIQKLSPQDAAELRNKCEKLGELGVLGRVGWPLFSKFPFEGKLFLNGNRLSSRLVDLSAPVGSSDGFDFGGFYTTIKGSPRFTALAGGVRPDRIGHYD